MAANARAVVARLAAGAPLDGLGLGKVGGRWDLRGLRLPETEGSGPRPVSHGIPSWERTELSHVPLVGLDLSEAILTGMRLIDVDIRDCVFDRARLDDAAMWETRVVASSFRSASMREMVMGGSPLRPWRRRYMNSWQDVDLSRADLRGSVHSAETYTDCDFSHARLFRVGFEASRHVRSRFAGRVDDCAFRRTPQELLLWGLVNPMQDVDMSEAELVDCGFWGLGLENVRLPRSPGHIVFRPKAAVARETLNRIAPSESSGSLAYLYALMERKVEEGPESATALGVIHREALGDTEDERAEAEAVLRSAITAVGEG